MAQEMRSDPGMGGGTPKAVSHGTPSGSGKLKSLAGDATTGAAKAALSGAKKFTQAVEKVAPRPSDPGMGGGSPKPVSHGTPAGTSISDAAADAGAGLAAKAANVKEYEDANPGGLPKMHQGGTVPKDGDYNLKMGERVIPASGRQSEYRKVFLQRQQRDKGGNQPVTASPEQHVEGAEKLPDPAGE